MFRKEHQLYGCVNDCLEWDKVLKEHFAFEEIPLTEISVESWTKHGRLIAVVQSLNGKKEEGT